MIITRDDVDGIFDLKVSLHHTFEMKDIGSLSYFLGLEVIFIDDGIYLSQAKYASNLLTSARITDSHTESTPLEPNVQYTPMDGTVLDKSYSLSTAYSDADWAGDPTDCHSTTCYCLFLGDALISWRAKEQTFTARSSTESEYRALANTTAEVVSIRWLLADLGAPQSSPIDFFVDKS
ncbi:uncharacterized protein LOC107640402 [Arachis ipaensis]|uniref:uncharacterized protein LOC107640402 n=1 Tax=Arachis ipaensis TaxID=130454 RepID=UPI0007AFD3AE|nr:uncharacterized protein LOC107640402 [Arachis ipaensis]